jgi:hypothetical protein
MNKQKRLNELALGLSEALGLSALLFHDDDLPACEKAIRQALISAYCLGFDDSAVQAATPLKSAASGRVNQRKNKS